MKQKIFFIITFFVYGFSLVAQTIIGIDVSSYQGTINWPQVKLAGYTFAWAKATEGLTVTDSQYLNNAVNGVSAGMYMGAYHFAHPDTHPTNADAIAEANHFLSVAQPYIVSCQLPPVLDLEVTTTLTNAQLTAWVQNWMNTVQAATGITPILYTDGTIANSLNSSLASYCKLWIADPDGSPTISPSSTYLGVWYPTWSFKQYSWTGTVPGISTGSVDLDSFNGNLAALQSLMGCTPPVCNNYYTSLPYSTSFETTWLTDSCSVGAQRVPDKYWKSKIGGTSSSGDDYWHRNDYTGADWSSTTSGTYTPAASTGNYSARFHNAPATASTTGALDLYVNLSPIGTKKISFDYIHKESSPTPFSFQVLLSTNGGSTFPITLLTITTASTSGWLTQTFTTSAVSSTSVFRFIATDKGLQDAGIDNLNIITIAPLSASGTQTNVLCNGNSTGVANVTASGGVGPYTYSWMPSGGNTSTASGLSAGVYTCTIADASSLITTKVFTITQSPVLNITVVSNLNSLCVGQSATLTASGAITYTWNTSAITSIIVISPTLNTTYTVIGTNASGCSNFAIITQSVSVCTGLISLLNDTQFGISIYPNPTNDILHIELEISTGKPTNITITNTLGQVVLNERIDLQKSSFNISNFYTGVYILRAENNGRVKTLRLIKE